MNGVSRRRPLPGAEDSGKLKTPLPSGLPRRDFLRGTLGGGGLLLTGAGSLSACRGPQPGGGESSGPLKLGVLVIRSGVAAPVGAAGQRATDWWLRRVNKAGGIAGRQVELVYEEETDAKGTVERLRKLVLQDRVEAVLGGISTGTGLALAPVVEQLGVPWLSWDATTQDGVKETVPNPKWAFSSADNEVEAIGAALVTAKHFGKDFTTVANIGNDYSYGYNNWESFMAAMKRLAEAGLAPETRQVLELFPALGETDFTSHVNAIQREQPDLLFCSFWSGDAAIFLKQAAAAGLFAEGMKGVFCTAGGVTSALKSDFTPEGIIVGYNSLYFDDPQASSLLSEFRGEYNDTHQEEPPYECDHAYFCAESYKAAVEKAHERSGDRWPAKQDVAEALPGIEVESLSGKRSWSRDHRQIATWFQGLSTPIAGKDYIGIDPVDRLPLARIQKPQRTTDLLQWIESWNIGSDGLPEAP